MPLSRLFLVPLLVAGTLPCLAQSPKQPSNSATTPFSAQVYNFTVPDSASLKFPTALTKKFYAAENVTPYLGGSISSCYSIRDYQFATPKGSGVPTLKSYSTCESASRFHMREVTIPPRQTHPRSGP